MRVLRVDAFEVYLLAVDVDQSVLYLDVAETEFRREGLLFAVAVLLRERYRVERGRFGRPQLQVRQRAERYEFGLFRLSGLEVHRQYLRGHCLTFGREQGYRYVLFHFGPVAVVHGEFHLHRTAAVVVGGIERTGDIVVADVGLGRGEKVYVAVDAAHVEHILSLEV